MKCKTCGRRFKLLAKNRYEIREVPIARDCYARYFNAFDCPKCGCQNVVSVVEKNRVESEETE